MSDHIMPMSKAVEGYDLFDKMKVQKGVLPVQYSGCPEICGLTRSSGFRSTEVRGSLSLHRMKRRTDLEKHGMDLTVFVTDLTYYRIKR